jgi:hypothetical protein
MATQAEIVASLKEANDKLKAANQKLTDTNTIILKIGTETDRLKEQIANLPVDGATPELVAAVDELKATSQATSDLVDTAKGSADADDAKVDDAP